jgi:hypothetical protein
MLEKHLERGAEAGRTIAEALLAPWGGPEVCIDAYEMGVRAATDAQLWIAKALHAEPARVLATAFADLTRDVGATQVSSARWLFDV